MFSPRWKLLKTLIEECVFTTSDRQISYLACLRLFEAFLLQVQKEEGIVYIIPSEEHAALANYFADVLTHTVKVSACALVPVHKDITLHLALLLKKTDLVITLDTIKQSANTLTATAMAKTSSTPLITFSGGTQINSFIEQGDLGIRFDTIDKHLIQTGHFSLLSTIVNTWSYNLPPPSRQTKPFLKQTKPHPFLTELRI